MTPPGTGSARRSRLTIIMIFSPHRSLLPFSAFLLLALISPQAKAVVITFEGLANLEPVNNYYNGGTGGTGSSGGPNYGVSFTSDSLTIKSNTAGGTGNFSNNPSGSNILFFTTGAGDTMNVAAGFTTGFSFYYAANYAGSVSVYSGLNGTGSMLASLALAVTSTPYTVWVPIGVSFAGTARSAVFGGSANYIGFDDITLGSATAGATTTSVPDSGSTLALLGLTLPGLALIRSRLASRGLMNTVQA